MPGGVGAVLGGQPGDGPSMLVLGDKTLQARTHVLRMVEAIRERSLILKGLETGERIKTIGCMHDMETAEPCLL